MTVTDVKYPANYDVQPRQNGKPAVVDVVV